MGSGASKSGDRDRVLDERLLTIEWQQRDAARRRTEPTPGSWLLITTSDAADLLATRLTDALKAAGAQCDALHWPQRADHRGRRRAAAAPAGRGGVSTVWSCVTGRRRRTGRAGCLVARP